MPSGHRCNGGGRGASTATRPVPCRPGLHRSPSQRPRRRHRKDRTPCTGGSRTDGGDAALGGTAAQGGSRCGVWSHPPHCRPGGAGPRVLAGTSIAVSGDLLPRPGCSALSAHNPHCRAASGRRPRDVPAPPTPVLTGPMSPPQSGVLSSLPFVAASTCTVLGGQLADFLLSRGLLRLVTVRKLFSCLGEGRRSPRPRAVRAGPSAGSDTAPPAQGCSSRRSVPWPCPSPPPAT